MRKVFLLMALCLVGALVFAPAALGQEDPCPDPGFPRETPDGCQASDLPDVSPGVPFAASASASASASATASASASAAATGDLDCGQLSEAEEQAVFDADPSDPNGLDADDDGLPCEDDTTDDGSYPAQEQPMVEETTMMEPTEMEPTTVEPTTTEEEPTETTTVALPATGGASVITLGAGVLLVAGGLAARRVVR